MPEQTRVERPGRWEEIAGIGEGRAKKLRQEVGRFDGTFSDIRDSRQRREIVARSTSSDAKDLPQYAENAVQAVRDPSPDTVDSSLVSTQQVDPRTARTRSKTEIRNQHRQDDRRDRGFSTMERDPDELDQAAERFADEYDGRFDVPAADLGRAAREQLPDDRATSQPLINTAGSRTVFRANDPADGFRQELERQTEQIDRSTASAGELADAFVGFVEQEVGLQAGPKRSAGGGFFTQSPTQPTDIGREADGEFARPESSPDIAPAPIDRDAGTGRFGLDPFDITAGVGGGVGGGVESREIEYGGEQVDLTEQDTGELENMNEFLSQNVDAEVEAQRAKGGFGTSDFAQEYSQKQTQVASELDRRRG